MKILHALVISTLVSAVSLALVVNADEGMESAATESMPMMHGMQGQMPMMQGQQGGMPMMQMMQQRQAKMDAHMQSMETHMSNIEELLKQLIELQKN